MSARQLSKWIVSLLVVSVLFVWGTWVSDCLVEPVDAIMRWVYLPALFVAVSFSTRDDVNTVILFAADVVQTFLMLLLVVWGAVAAIKRLKRPRS